MRGFLIGMSPAILGFVFLGIGLATGANNDSFLMLPLVFFGIGAVLSGAMVASRTYHGIKSPQWWKVVGAILAFLGVGVAYFGATVGGCCAIVLAGAY